MELNQEYILYKTFHEALYNYENSNYSLKRDIIKKATNNKNTDYLENFKNSIISTVIYTAFIPPDNSSQKSSYDTAGVVCIYDSLIAYSHKGLFGCTQGIIDLKDVFTITLIRGNGLYKSLYDNVGSICIWQKDRIETSFTINYKDIPYVVSRIVGATMYEGFPFMLANSHEYAISFIRKSLS